MTDILEGEVIETEDLPVASNMPAVVEKSTALVARDELSVDDLLHQMDVIQNVMQRVMKPNVHYGVIPGTDKPTLFQAGAQTLNVVFRLCPTYDARETWHEDGHLSVVSTCRLTHIPTGMLVASGDGLCTTRESRYAYRQAKRACPSCGAEAIIKGKAEYGGGWVCFKKQGGCGAKFADGTPAIETQTAGQVDNPDLPDLYNTVLKMANKRALVAATINGTAASDVFTQDMEDAPVQAAPTPATPPEDTDMPEALRTPAYQHPPAEAPKDADWPGSFIVRIGKNRGMSLNEIGSTAKGAGWIKWASESLKDDDGAGREHLEAIRAFLGVTA